MIDFIRKFLRITDNDCTTIVNTQTGRNVFNRHEFIVDYDSGVGRCRKCGIVLVMHEEEWKNFFGNGESLTLERTHERK